MHWPLHHSSRNSLRTEILFHNQIVVRFRVLDKEIDKKSENKSLDGDVLENRDNCDLWRLFNNHCDSEVYR